MTKDLQDRNSAFWCLIGCDNILANTVGDPIRFVDYSISALNVIGWKEVFGWEMDREKFLKIGERVYNLTHLFNLREGFTRTDDRLPERLKEPRQDTGWEISEGDFTKMLSEYYSLRGWDNKGEPIPETLARLQIEVDSKGG